MPNIGVYHPQIIHFVVVLLIVGVVFRWVSLTRKVTWSHPVAALALITGTIAAVLAVQSGHDAHGPVERVPGAREAVIEHEELGEKTRNIFLVIGVLELGALALGTRAAGKAVRLGSALVGLAGLYFLYEAAEHGGDLVYEYAGGVGIRSGDPEDVERLLVAGLYHEAQLDRKAGDADGAARLLEEMARRRPGDAAVQILAAESQLRDRKDPAAALAALDAITLGPADARLESRIALLRADALAAAGMRDSALALVKGLAAAQPDNQRIADKLKELQGTPPAP